MSIFNLSGISMCSSAALQQQENKLNLDLALLMLPIILSDLFNILVVIYTYFKLPIGF